MGREHLFEVGEGDAKTSRMRTGLDVAKEYVKSKLVARVSGAGPSFPASSKLLTLCWTGRQIIRDLKTTPIGVILFGYSKTKNLLTTRAKENAAEREVKFDRADDPYRHCYELIPLRKELDKSLIDQVDLAVAGEGPDGDGEGVGALRRRAELALTQLLTRVQPSLQQFSASRRSKGNRRSPSTRQRSSSS